MKSELDSILSANHLDGLLVTGPANHNPAMVYFTGICHLTHADLVKKKGHKPILTHLRMERDEAAKTGLELVCYDNYAWQPLLESTGGNEIKATAMRYAAILQDAGLSKGRVALYGMADAGQSLAIFTALQEELPQLNLVADMNEDALAAARVTKDEMEIARIRAMAEVTVQVAGRLADFLSNHYENQGMIVQKNGSPLTIGMAKRQVNLWLAELGAENPEGTILAMGYDSAVPHSSGQNDQPFRTGQTIVFDIFPCEAGGGYFYDLTRTWCLGYAPSEAIKIYQDVLSVRKKLDREMIPTPPLNHYHLLSCELFAEMGHPTSASHPGTQQGYVHGIGHGIGLQVHEKPVYHNTNNLQNLLRPGVVFTIEPGLYYPDQNIGVRLEDTYWVTPEGNIEVLAEFPYDLVLPIKNR
jgi:Xaa-Pro aminopeptidase